MDIDITEFDWFNDDGIFLPMLNDRSRNSFYKKAIDNSVKDKVVCDVGTGTGLLSILSAKAGARKVFAVERDQKRAEYAKNIIEELRLTDTVEVINDDFLNLDIPADIFVSETINTQIFGEDILQIAEHARKQGGVFIPSEFVITPVIYKHHPIFMLDQTRSESWEFKPNIEVDSIYRERVNRDFQSKHPEMETLYRANQLNKLFQFIHTFTDVKLEKLWEGNSLTVDLNQPIDINSVSITIPYQEVNDTASDWYMVFHWQARFQDVVMNSNSVWFGNVSKHITSHHINKNDIKTWYNPKLRDWHVVW